MSCFRNTAHRALSLTAIGLALQGCSAPEDVAAVTDVAAAVDDVIGSLVRVSWQQATEGPAKVQYLVDDTWQETPEQQRESGDQEQLLLGIPYDYTVTVRVVVDGSTSQDVTVSTDARPEDIPAFELLTSDPDNYDPDRPWMLFSVNEPATSYGGPWWTVITDRQARVVWALKTPTWASTLYARPARDGQSILIDYNSFWTLFDKAETSQVARFGIDGVEHAITDTPGMGHAFTDMPDGSLTYPIGGENEGLIALDDAGAQHMLWSCADFMASNGLNEGCGANSVDWFEATDTFLLSSFSCETVFEIDRSTGELIRWFGHLPGSWTFDPPESIPWWQHGALYTDAGTILLSTKKAEDVEETVVREFEVDAEEETLREIWSFGEGEGLYGETLGEAHRFPNGNTLQNLGSYARMREVTPEGQVVWDVEITGPNQFLGRTTPLESLYDFIPDGD